MTALPDYVQILLDGFAINPNSAVLRTETDDGSAKQARRYSRVLVKHPVACKIDGKANLLAFREWVKTDLEGGAAWFDWVDPISEETVQARIESGKYSCSPLGSMDAWQVTFTLETWES